MENTRIKPEGTLINRAVKLDRFFNNTVARLIFLLIWIMGIVSVFFIIKTIFVDSAPEATTGLGYDPGAITVSNASSGIYYILLAVFLIYWPLRSFYKEKVSYPHTMELKTAKEKLEKNESINLFSLFSFQLAKATAKSLGSKSTTRDLALAIADSPDMNFILVRLGISKKELTSALRDYKGSDNVFEILQAALDVAIIENHHQIEVGDVFVVLCEKDKFFNVLITDMKLEAADIAHVVYWQTGVIRKQLEGRRFLDPRRFRLTGGFGRDWAYGYTPLLKQFSRDLTDAIRSYGLGLDVIGREKEITEIQESMLRENGGSVVLVGEPGVGKRTTVLGLANKMASGESDEQLAYKHLVEINIEALLAGFKNSGDLIERLSSLFNEVIYAGNIIVFIEDIEKIVGGQGLVDAEQIIMPFLEASGMHLIATTDTASYNQFIRTSSALAERLTRVTVTESDKSETIRILEDVVPTIEGKTKSLISFEAIKATVSASEKYVLDVPNPEKSINLLDGATAHATSSRGETIIMPKDVMDYVSDKFEVPPTEVGEEERTRLLSIEEIMHKRVIGQNEAVKAIGGALKRARAGVTDSKKPIGSFLFLGPTGVGKTETAKALTEAYFGNENKILRFDMSEYQNEADIYRFIGSAETGEQGNLATAMREHPFSLVLFDEVEKANPKILDLFLQVLDEGFLTDGLGRKVSFTNSIIICTSNAGANLIREAVRNNTDYELTKKTLLDSLQKENIYRPEFLNRFTQIVLFAPLTQEEIGQVAGLMIERLKKVIYANRKVKLEVVPEAVTKLAQIGYDPEMGARPMARTIQEKVEDVIADKLLSGEIKEGDSYTVTPDMI